MKARGKPYGELDGWPSFTAQLALPCAAVSDTGQECEVDPLHPFSATQRRRALKLALVPLALLVAGTVGQVLYAALVERRPLLLMVLNSTDIVLIGVANQLPAALFIAVGTFRLYVTDPFLYRLGETLGTGTHDYLVATLGSRSRIGRTYAWLAARMARSAFGWIALFALPGYPMCLLAGAARMAWWWFHVVNVAGTVTRLVLIWWATGWFENPIGRAVNFLNRYALLITIGLLALTVIHSVRAKK